MIDYRVGDFLIDSSDRLFQIVERENELMLVNVNEGTVVAKDHCTELELIAVYESLSSTYLTKIDNNDAASLIGNPRKSKGITYCWKINNNYVGSITDKGIKIVRSRRDRLVFRDDEYEKVFNYQDRYGGTVYKVTEVPINYVKDLFDDDEEDDYYDEN